MNNSKNRLMALLPKYYADNTEMLDITNAELPEIDDLWQALEDLLLNQFIKTADIHRIRQWERLLRIRPDTTTQSLKQRREIVLLRLQMRPPLTRRWLEGFLAERFGADSYLLEVIHNNHTMNLSVELSFCPEKLSCLMQESMEALACNSLVKPTFLFAIYNTHSP
jgi:uncharacterized protein YmfQ (DUF2313 family)